MNGYLTHFRTVLKEYPESIRYLQILQRSITQNERVPARILLEKSCSTIPPVVIQLFGVAGVKLSLSGELRLVPSRLFEGLSDRQSTAWIDAVHEICGGKKPGRATIVRIEERACETLLQRLRILFPDMGLLVPHLEILLRSTPSLRKAAVAGGLFYDWKRCGEAVRFLYDSRECLTVSDLGGRFFGDSKLLRTGSLITTIADWLTILDSNGEIVPWQDPPELRHRLRADTLARYGVVTTTCGIQVMVYGPLRHDRNGNDWVCNCWKSGEAAVLTLDNLEQIDRIEIPDSTPVITCENESPFENLVRERHKGIIIYTQGFPNAAVKQLYSIIVNKYPEMSLYHWGDSDLPGLRIAAMLHAIAPLRLWRCDIDSLRQHRRALIKLTPAQKESARAYLNDHREFPFSKELAFTVEHGWLEQEQWHSFVDRADTGSNPNFKVRSTRERNR